MVQVLVPLFLEPVGVLVNPLFLVAALVLEVLQALWALGGAYNNRNSQLLDLVAVVARLGLVRLRHLADSSVSHPSDSVHNRRAASGVVTVFLEISHPNNRVVGRSAAVSVADSHNRNNHSELQTSNLPILE